MSLDRFGGVPELNPAAVQEKYHLWDAGEPVHSELVAIGRLALSPGEIWTFEHDRGMFEDFQNVLSRGRPLGRQFAEARDSLRELARQDLARVGIDNPTLKETLHAGYFMQRKDIEPWHISVSPEFPEPQPTVIYSVVHGAAPTRGLDGQLSREDIIWEEGDQLGHFKPGVPIGPNKRLQPVDFEPGTVLRYTTLDGHASGNISIADIADGIADSTVNGGRLATQVRIVLPAA